MPDMGEAYTVVETPDGQRIPVRTEALIPDAEAQRNLEGLLRKARRQQREIEGEKSPFPYQDGDVTVLGPGVFVSSDGSRVSVRGINYIPQDEALENMGTLLRVRVALEERLREVQESERENGPSPWTDGILVTCARIQKALDPSEDPS